MSTQAEAQASEHSLLDGYVAEEVYAQIRGASMRTCQRDRQLRRSPPYVKLGRRVFYRIDAAREWLISHEQTPFPEPQRRRRLA